MPASLPLLGLATATACYHMIDRSPQVIGGAAAALLAASAGIGWVIFRESATDLEDLIALAAVGVAGVVLSSLLPGTPFLVYLAMAGLGMRLPVVQALTAGLVVFAALNLAFLLAAPLSPASPSPSSLAGQDLGAAFFFAIGAFARSARISRDISRAAQARAEDLLAQLRASQAGPALLDRLVRETAAATGITATLTVTGEQRPLPPEIGLALYRTAQETLINTAKYAGSGGQAELRLSYQLNDVELMVQDTRADGAGPARPGGLTFGGYGLTGMRERAELLGGSLSAGPTEQGFLVRLRLPAVPVAAS